MIPLLIMVGAMVLGFVAPQVAQHRAMKGVFVPPFEEQVPEQPRIVKPMKCELEGKI